jgi:uncharacterized protein (TIGR02231 family)
MKKLFIILMSITLISFSAYADGEKDVNSKINEVTVFLQGAQVTRTANVSIPAGTTDLVFDGVSPYLNTNSIKAGGTGNFIVMDVRYNTEYVPPGTKNKNVIPASLKYKIKGISDSLIELNFDIEELTFKQNAWTKEKNILEQNLLVQDKIDSLPLFMAAIEFYRIKIQEINEGLMVVKKKLYYANLLKTKLNTRLNELNTYKYNLESENVIPAKSLYQVIVTVSATYATTGTVNINYFVNNANWAPSYDIRANNSTSPINLIYKANIVQNTGEDWDNAKLTLSTMNPNQSNTKPILSIWYLRYYVQTQVVTATNLSQSNMVMDVSAKRSSSESYATYDAPTQLAAAYTQQVSNMANVEFEIDLIYSIPSDGKSHMVSIMEEDVSSIYKHYVVPKMDQEAFLVARMSGWEDLNLLPGSANVYFMNTFVGSTYIDPNTIEDTLDVVLGRDQSIAVSRKKLKDKEKNQVIGQNREKTITIEVTIRNKKNEEVNITVEDQVPVSAEEGIKVTFDPNTVVGASYNEDTGALTWDLTMKARETKTLQFTYKIKYPKDRRIQ